MSALRSSKKASGPASPADRRTDKRHSVKLAIRFRDRRNLKGEFIRDISYGGVFVSTQYPMPVGTKVHLTLEGPQAQIVSIDGEVVWSSLDLTPVSDPNNPAGDLRPKGMGIRFSKKDRKIYQAMHDFIDKISH